MTEGSGPAGEQPRSTGGPKRDTPWLLIVVGVVALVAFVVWELRSPRPLLDIRVFAHRGLATGSVTLLILFAVMSGCSWC